MMKPSHILQLIPTLGSFAQSGPHDRFLRRMLVLAASIGMLILAPQNWGPIVLRLPHTFGMLAVCYVLIAVVMTAAGGLALVAHLRERFFDSERNYRITHNIDIAWQSLSILALALYLLTLAACVATTEPFDHTRLAYFSNQHPLQYLAMVFMVLSIAVLSERMRVAFLLTTSVMIALLPMLENVHPPTFSDFDGPVLVLSFNLTYLVGSSWLLRQSVELDSTQALLAQEEIATRRQNALTDARRRMNNFIHDHILSALIPLAAGVDDRMALRVTARQALDVLDRRAASHDMPTTTQLFTQLEQLAIEMDPEIILRRKELYIIALPPNVGQSLLDAAHEALNNSMRHAASPGSPRPRRALSMGSSARLGVRISISDDGRGFDPAKADDSRLGIRHSILQRMDNVGGHVVFDSYPGYGTRVLLSYTPASQRLKEKKAGGTGGRPVSIGKSMESRPARAVAGYAILAHLYQLLAHWDDYRTPWAPTAALALEAAMVVLLFTRWPRATLPPWACFLVPFAGGAANMAVLASIPATGWPENEAWSLGFTAMLCWGLVVRGQLLAAWLGVVLLVATSAVWVLASGLPPLLIFTMTLGHVLSLAMWTLITTLAQWGSVSIFRDEELRMDLEAHRIEDLQTNQVVETTFRRVEEKVRPLLETIESSAPLTSQVREQAALIEAELRDEIRGGHHLTGLLGPHIKRARERGVVVLLMNDRGENAPPPSLLDVLHTHVAAALENVTQGRVVIRLVPARVDQQTFATFSSPLRSFSIRADGSVADV